MLGNIVCMMLDISDTHNIAEWTHIVTATDWKYPATDCRPTDETICSYNGNNSRPKSSLLGIKHQLMRHVTVGITVTNKHHCRN